MICNAFICKIIFVISGYSKITVFKDFILEIIKFKVTKKGKKRNFPRLKLQLSFRLDI